MIHQGSAGFHGTPADIDIQAREVLAVRQRLAELLAEHTGVDVTQVEHDIDRDRFMTAQEALDYRIVDEVFASRKLRALVGAGVAAGT
jgi:ATP-dependent Clp protease, protease subunit